MDEMSDRSFEEILGALSETLCESRKSAEVMGLLPSARALLLAKLYEKTARPMLIITGDNQTGRELHRDLEFFWPAEKGRGGSDRGAFRKVSQRGGDDRANVARDDRDCRQYQCN